MGAVNISLLASTFTLGDVQQGTNVAVEKTRVVATLCS